MRAVIMNKPFHAEVGPWQTPKPAPGEVLVSVAASGICAGDMYCYLGKNPYVVFPQICGHEISGTVTALGEGVAGPAPGTPVVVEPFIGCGKCYPCRVGKSNCCVNLRIIGVHQPGGYAEFVVAPAELIHVVPAGLSPVYASFAEPVAIGVQACRRGEIGAEDVLVLGSGPIGLAVLEVAKARGARVLIADVVPQRLETAAKFGAETVAADEHLLQQVLDRTHGEGFPVVVDATGNLPALESTVDLVASGGRIVVLSLFKQGVGASLPALDLTRKEMTIVGSRASVNCFPEALALMASGAITYPQVATEFNMWDAPQVFADLAQNPTKVQKGVFVIG